MLSPKITLEQALDLIRKLDPEFRKLNFHTALAGGVLLRGSSEKDIDLALYPFGGKRNEVFANFGSAQLEGLGFTIVYSPDNPSDDYHEDGDDMRVFVTRYEGIRVDIFILR